MKILFLRPSMGGGRAADAMEPLVFAILRSLTPSDVETILIDERVEAVDHLAPVDLVAMTVETYTALRAYQLAADFRRRGIPVVMGGHHPTLLPEEALLHADSVVVGDAEGVWPELVEDFRAARLKRLYRSTGAALAVPEKPDRSIFAGKAYLPIGLVQHGRGCPYTCDFCSVSAFYGGRMGHRPAAQVADEIAQIGRRNLFLVDDNLLADPCRTEELLRALVPLRVRWTCQVSLDVAADERMLDLLAESGCAVALIGFESLDRRNLEQMGKAANLAGCGDYAAAVERFRQRGIMVYGTFLFGYDHDTPAAIEAALAFAIRNRLSLANFNPLTPFPGTPLFERLRREERLLHERWWLDPSCRYGQALFHPRGMTAQELEAGCFRARREFHRFSSILRRGVDRRANCRNPAALALFLAANLVSRREILRKQGSPLGGSLLQTLGGTP
jgi:radical SAM superfamily enzyme YgiQ (UPF0313 family)